MHGAIIKVCHETETLEFTKSMHMHQNGTQNRLKTPLLANFWVFLGFFTLNSHPN